MCLVIAVKINPFVSLLVIPFCLESFTESQLFSFSVSICLKYTLNITEVNFHLVAWHMRDAFINSVEPNTLSCVKLHFINGN